MLIFQHLVLWAQANVAPSNYIRICYDRVNIRAVYLKCTMYPAGVDPSDLSGDAGAGAARDHAERHSERPLELHDRRKGHRSRQGVGGGLRVQCDPARLQPQPGHGLPPRSRRQDHQRPAVELLRRHPRLPLRPHHRRSPPPQGPHGTPCRGGLPGDRDTYREQPQRR